MPPALTVTLSDGTLLTAERLSDTAYLPLGSVILEEGEDFPDMSKPGVKQGLASRIFRNLRSHAFVKDLAFGLLTIFPTIPSDRVWFDDSSQKPPYGVAGLSVKDIIKIIGAVSTAVTPRIATPTNGFAPPSKPQKNKNSR